MDNFMDKLAQKFNAQEMIKANAQAEANEMQRLQEQVAAYESILQDMRKLNYKNSELTDKIYALVDESINKVQGSQVAGADNSEVAANLSDSIMVALDEAISNLDSAFGTALNESVSGALMVPVDQMKQSTQEVSGSVAAVRQIAEDVKISADEMRYISADLKESTEGLRTSNEELKATVKTSVDNALLAIRRENREIADHLEYIRTSVETIHKPDPNEESLKLEQEQLKEQREQEKEEARIAREEENRKQIEELFKQADDFVHKENVKVYRNVQAVVVDELRSQTEGLTKHNRELYSKLKATNVAVVVSIIFGAINLIFMILFIFGIIG
ncbi:MAG: hypothetical protein E7288_10620 [Lachnospiraceae bacterium]|nr:hypothetical protein [Lachnospiraceae bacterium]